MCAQQSVIAVTDHRLRWRIQGGARDAPLVQLVRFWQKSWQTRMHSSRMHTAQSSSRRGVSASVHAGIDTPQVWTWRPPWVWAWRHPPWPDPPQLSPWVWAWRPPPARSPSTSPWVWAWRPPRPDSPQLPPPWRPAARHAGIEPPSVDRMTDACKNMTFSNFVCGR